MLTRQVIMILMVGFVGLKWLLSAKKNARDNNQTAENPLSGAMYILDDYYYKLVKN